MSASYNEDIEKRPTTPRSAFKYITGAISSLLIGAINYALLGMGIIVIHFLTDPSSPPARWWGYVWIILHFVLMSAWAIGLHLDAETFLSGWIRRTSGSFRSGFKAGVIILSALSFSLIIRLILFN